MSRNNALAGRLREVLLDGRWIANTNYSDQLRTLTWQQAVQKVSDLNTIAALTFHINYYLEGLLSAFENGRLDISDKYSFDMPALRSEEDWVKLRHTFLSNAERFVQKVESLDESLLDQAFFDEKYGTYQRNLDGVIEHCYYHLGQITLIKKMILQV